MLTHRTRSYPSRLESGVYPATIGPDAAFEVLSEAGMGVWSCTASAPCILASHTARRIFGLNDTSELALAEGGMDRVHPEDRRRAEEELEGICTDPGPFAFELRIVTDAGEARWVEIHGVSHHEEGRFVRASGTVRASGPRARLELHRDLRIGASLPCARRLTNLGMIAALVVDEMQAVHAGRTIHLALSGNLDGEWDAERLSQAIANLLAKALEGDPERPVALRVAGRGNDVHVMVECRALEGAPAVGGEGGASSEPAPMIARDIVRAHGGSLHELSSAGRRTRVLAVLPRRAG